MPIRHLSLFLAALIVLISLSTACASRAIYQPVPEASPEPVLQQLRVRTNLEVHHHQHPALWTNPADTEGSPDAQAKAYERLWHQLIEERLSEQGIASVGEHGTPDIELFVTVEPIASHQGYVTYAQRYDMRWRLEVLHDGESIDGAVWTAPLAISSEGFESRSEARQAQQEALAQRVVNRFFVSEPTMAVARSLGEDFTQDQPPVATIDPAPPAARALEDHLIAAPQPGAHALVIGIEKYRDLTPTPGARGDAEQFAEMLEKTLGVSERNIHLLTDNRATRGDILSKLRELRETVPSDGRIYFFFSGHGTPHVESGASYLLPYEGRPETLDETGLLLEDVLTSLEDTQARDVLAFLDSCFSGSGDRSTLPEGTRPLVPVQEVASAPRVAVFSSSGASEISGNAPGADEGLFTRHLIDAIARGRADIDGDGQISLSELKTYVAPRVAREARELNRNQNPTLRVSEDLGDPDQVIMVWGLPRD